MALYELRLMRERNPSFHHMRCIAKVGDALDDGGDVAESDFLDIYF